MCLKDNGYNMGQVSVGAMQCINKSNNKRINNIDKEKIVMLSKFIGGLAVKAREFFSCLTMVVGMIQKTQISNDAIN